MLTTIVSLDPMYAYFDVDERTMLRIRRLIRAGKVRSAQDGDVKVYWAWPTRKASRTRERSTSSTTRWTCPTGTLRLRGDVSQSRAHALAGMFVRIRVPIGDPHQALLVSERALGSDQGRSSCTS